MLRIKPCEYTSGFWKVRFFFSCKVSEVEMVYLILL